jgi:hypothetical protein
VPGRTIPDWRPAGPPSRLALLGLIALLLGLAVAALDSRPGWDDTGITAGLLAIGAAVIAAIDGRRPWLWALLVGGPLPIIETLQGGSPASLIAIAFAGVGSTLGYAVARGSRARAA